MIAEALNRLGIPRSQMELKWQAAPEGEYVHDALNRDLAVALQRLSATERQAFLLKHIEGWRLDEIAESLQTSISNVKSALFRGIRKLRVDLHVWRSEP